MNNFKCIVTDLDQVICKSQQIHGGLESKILAHFGLDVTPESIALNFTGMGTENVFKHFLQPHQVTEAMGMKEEGLANIGPQDIFEIEGACDFYRSISKNIPVGVASGSSLTFINLVLESLQLKELFSVVASGEEVENGKPEPDVFLLALERLNCNPSESIIIEDGLSGIIAARKIGAYTIGITTSYSKERLLEAGAHHVVDSFEKLKFIITFRNKGLSSLF